MTSPIFGWHRLSAAAQQLLLEADLDQPLADDLAAHLKAAGLLDQIGTKTVTDNVTGHETYYVGSDVDELVRTKKREAGL